MNTLLAKGRCTLTRSSINVVFISLSAFEPRIKNMNPISISSEENGGGEFFDQPAPIQERPGLTATLKLVEFSVELPDAKIVQLAADFTEWEEAPLDMMRFDSGIWVTTVPLPAGIYAYRFLADGEWYDDPRAARRDPDSPGAAKTFVQVK